MADYNGESATIAGAVIGGLFGAFDAITQGLTFSQTLQYALSGAITGAIAGFAADLSVATLGLGAAVAVSAAASGVTGFTNSLITDKIRDPEGKVNWGNAVINGVIGASMGALGTLATAATTAFVKGSKNGIRYVVNTIQVEMSAMMTNTLPRVVNQLVEDTMVTGVTNLGNMMFSKRFTS